MRPAAPAIMPPIRKVSEIVTSTLIPSSFAASGSCAVARMAFPSRLRATNAVRMSSSGIVAPSARMSPRVIVTVPNVKTGVCDSIRSSTPNGLPPSHSSPTFWRMNEKPIAVINGASLGAFRSGR
jgi:hypothetical protein